MNQPEDGARRAPFVSAAVGVSIALAIGLVTWLARPAHAYVQSVTTDGFATRWPKHTVDLQFYAADPPSFLSHAQALNMVRASAATWSKPAVTCTDLVLNVEEVASAVATAEYDCVNRIGFRRDDWSKMPCTGQGTGQGTGQATLDCNYGPNAIAITTVTSNRRTGDILDADIEINAVTQRFADVVTDGPSARKGSISVQDLQNTLTHEIGHLIGLDHNCHDPLTSTAPPKDHNGNNASLCASASSGIAEATMFNSALPGETKKRDLDGDDLRAVCDVYKPGAGSEMTCALYASSKSGGCAFAGAVTSKSADDKRSARGAGLLLTAFALAGAIIRATRRRR